MASEGPSTTPTEDSTSLPELYNPSKKITPAKAMEPKVKLSHPSTADMVTEAIVQLAERNGSSLPAIKKYIAKTYKLDVDKQAIYIKRYLKSAVANGSLVQTKGKGASGSFKMPSAKQKAAMAKAALQENPNLVEKAISPKTKESAKFPSTPTKKQASSKKASKKESAVEKKTKLTKQMITATPPKSPSRTKKMAKSPTSKPKAPKPKKANAAKPQKGDSSRKITTVKK